MRKYLEMLKYEFKNIVRDKMTLVMLLYPLLIIVIGSFVLPTLIENYGETATGQKMAALMIVIVFANIAPFITAAMLGFNLIDHRDENTLNTIRVTPLSLKGYVIFKTIYAYFISANASFWALYGVKILSGDNYNFHGYNIWNQFTLSNILIFALVAALFTPVFALILAAFSKNKIEGFAYMKTAGMLTVLPAVLVLDTMQDFKQYFLGFLPTFWPMKGMLSQAELLTHSHNISYSAYMLIGIVYALSLTIVAFKWFDHKVQV